MARKNKKPRKFQFLLYPPESVVADIRAARAELKIEERSANQIAVEILSMYLPAWVRAERSKRSLDAEGVANGAV